MFTEYHNSSILARFTEEPGLWFNIHHGLYIEDEHGVRYGKGYPSRDTETYRSFVNKYGERYGIIFDDVDGNRYAWRFYIPLNQIPKSAGRLTLKTILESGETGRTVQLPISVVIRQ